MKKKLLGIFVCILLIATALPAVGKLNKTNNLVEDLLKPEFVHGEFIVKFKNPTIQSTSINDLNEKYQISTMEKIFRKSENTILNNIYTLRVPEEADILSIVKDYASLPDVVYAEPNYILRSYLIPMNTQQSVPTFINELSSNVNTNDPDFSKQWALNNTGQIGGTPDSDIDAPEAWGIETGDPDVVIAIIDSGVDYTHPDLADNIWINIDEIPNNGIDDDGNGYIDDVRGWDFVNDDNIPLDDNGHGTHCAGIAAAESNNGIGIAGIAPNCKIMPIRVLGFFSGNVSTIALGIRYAADNGADVISLSLGGSNESNLEKDAVDYAYNKSVVLVSAAGNAGKDIKSYPAAFDNVIAVGATDNNDNRMFLKIFGILECVSNYGSWVDVAAPGEWIYSTLPTYFVFYNLFGRRKNYGYDAGTSMAAPYVAGLAALLLSKNPSLSPDEVKSLICENVDPYDSKYYIGTGRVNAFKALNKHIKSPYPPETPSGTSHGQIGDEYTYTTNTTDPEGDQLYYMWNWGDEFSNWIGKVTMR